MSDLALRQVSKEFTQKKGKVRALEDVNLELRDGEFVSVVGPSGCGKSTLLRLVAGLARPSSGEILMGGRPIQSPPEEVGIVFQRPVLLPWRSVYSNITLQIEIRGRDAKRYRKRAEELIALVGLEGFEDSYPHQLSGGMQQRVALCRALIHEPTLLLMDEPFGALDAITREQMNLEVYGIWRKTHTTILFITHSISEAVFLSQRVAVMSGRPGQIRDVVEIGLGDERSISSMETAEFMEGTRRVRAVMGGGTGLGD